MHSDSELSSNYEEDEDSKMMELPDVAILLTDSERNKNKSIRLISPKQSNRYSPKQTPNQSPTKYKKYDNYTVIDCVHECTSNAMIYSDSKTLLKAINWTNSHFWKRFNLSFSLGLFCCSIIALILTLYNNYNHDENYYIYKYSSICVILMPFLVFCIILFRICLNIIW